MNKPIHSTILFTILGFLRPALGVILVPVYLKYLTPKEYGILALIVVFSTVIALIGNLRLDTALRIKYFDYYHDETQLQSFLKNIFSSILFLSLLWTLVLLLIGPALFQILFHEVKINFYPLGIIACLGAFSKMTIDPYFIYLRNKIKLKEYTVLTLFIIGFSALLQILLITFYDLKIMGYLLGNAIPSLIVLLIIILKYKLVIWIKKLNKQILLSSLKFSLPLLPYVILELLISKGDRYFISFFLNLKQVGLYTLLITIVTLIEIVVSALDNSLRPVLYDLFKKGIIKNKKAIQDYFSLYVAIGLICLYGLFVAGNNLNLITSNTDYLVIKQYFGLAVLAVSPIIFTRIFNMQLMYLNKSNEISWFTFYKTILVILLFILLIPQFGIHGVLISLLVSNVFSLMIFGFKAVTYMKKIHGFKLYIFPTIYISIAITTIEALGLNENLFLLIALSIPLVGNLIYAYIRTTNH